MPFTKIQNISSCVKTLKEKGYWIYGLDMKAERSITDITFPKKICLRFYNIGTQLIQKAKNYFFTKYFKVLL